MRGVIVLLGLLWGGVCFGQGYKPSENESTVQFKVRNFGFNVTGVFKGLSGSIIFDPARPEASSFDVSVNAASVNTDNGMRDDHLRKPTYFDVEKYPRIRLVSGSIKAARKGMFQFTGQLSLKNHTRDISFPFTAEAADGGGYRFKGAFSINRKDFDVGGTSTISDNLDVELDVIAK